MEANDIPSGRSGRLSKVPAEIAPGIVGLSLAAYEGNCVQPPITTQHVKQSECILWAPKLDLRLGAYQGKMYVYSHPSWLPNSTVCISDIYLLIGGHHFLPCQQTNSKDIAGQSATPTHYNPTCKIKQECILWAPNFHWNWYLSAWQQPVIQIKGS